MTISNTLLRAALLVSALIGSGTLFAQTLKIASLAPDGSSWMTEFRAAGDTIAKRTDKRVQLKFYPGGVMGDDQAVLRKIKIGQLHGGALTAGSLTEFHPNLQLYSLPLVFRNLDEVDAARKVFDPRFQKGLDEGGMVSFGFAEGGFAYIMSTQSLTTIDDVRKRKVWIPSGDQFAADLVSSFNISPTPLPLSDVLVSLQSGLIDTVATSPIGALALQWHNQVKYVTDLPLVYVFASFVIDKKAFNKINEADQKIVREELTKMFARLDKQNRQDNLSAMEALKKQGLKLVTPEPAAIQEWYNTAEKANQKLVNGGKLSNEAYQQLLSIVRAKR